MKIIQKYTVALLMVINTMQICAMDNQHQASSLQIIAANHVSSQSEQDSVIQDAERQARWKRNENITNLLSDPKYANKVLEMLEGSAPASYAVTSDQIVAPWGMHIQQYHLVRAIICGDSHKFKQRFELIDIYNSLFPFKHYSNFNIIQNYKNNSNGYSLLHDIVDLLLTPASARASENSQLAIIKLLLDRGANINLQAKNGITPLHVIIQQATPIKGQSSKVVKMLLERGASVDLQDTDGKTPLHYAVQSISKMEMVELLLDYGAYVNIQDKNGNTPLHNAARGNSMSIVVLLLVRGAHVNIRNNDGVTPQQLANYSDVKDMINAAVIKQNESTGCSIM